MIIFGLGNPGSPYRLTRHNVGYRVADRLARHFKKRFRARRGYKVAIIAQRQENIHIVKPLCWMNQSGVAVKHYMEGIDDTFMVVVDDVNLPLGRIRLRQRGSDGGHNGVRSVIEEMVTDGFPRLRVGIGRHNEDLADYVLSRFARGEKKILDQILDKTIEGFMILFHEGFQKAQNFINSVDLSEK